MRKAMTGGLAMRGLLMAAALLLGACTSQGLPRLPDTAPVEPLVSLAAMLPADAPAPSGAQVQRIVERRCVVCHGCYDAPCQLKLVSDEGLTRGASPADVYDTERLGDAPPTRLGLDATTEAGWRDLGFHSVLARAQEDDPASSLMARMLALGRAAPFEPDAPLPATLSLDRDRALACPKAGAFEAYAAAAPQGGMPYGTAPLPEAEFQALGAWTLAGAPLPRRETAPSPAVAARLAEFEAFLNAPDPRGRLVARYLYEHLFLAHLHVEGDTPDRFHRLVRSRTPPGAPVEPVATRRPYDDPGGAFSYRLVPLAEAITHKDHLVYEIGPRRLARLRALFLGEAWQAGPAPGWGAAGANPFLAFAAIPAQARYRFLLDDALFFVRGFIRGPVCRGQVATDVIEDRFWVAFLAPEADLSTTDPSFLAEGAPLLSLPAAAAEARAFRRLWFALHDRHAEWLSFRDARYAASPAHRDGPTLASLWAGEGPGSTELLTVFRNDDNATAVAGFVGDTPKTGWVIDYPIFERIFYDLVASYDVFGSLETQLTTRLYMDHLRREAEDVFLSFLPPDVRQPLHEAWYRGPLADLHASWNERRVQDRRPTQVAFASDDPKAELLAALPARAPARWPEDRLNRCPDAACAGLPAVERTLARLAGQGGDWARYLPDVALLRVTGPRAQVFTLFHDKAHSNVGLLFGETRRREPERDRLTLLAGQAASYPNLFFEVPAAQLDAFAADLGAMRSQADWLAVVARHGVRRASPRFWAVADAMTEDMIAQDRVQAGLLDLNRYRDPRPGEAED
ncbi:fatty acid cis/trans isomerase [uncultured Albimonas sp.]|uniref:fatty acid cis/trans isomerase n=1 Tax=uncultured Albimonas sp. TaxID=1331701 RepID=UPI0030EEFAD3